MDEIDDVDGSDVLARFTEELREKFEIETIPWRDFELEPDDFLDINHMNARGGRDKLSRQLAAMILK